MVILLRITQISNKKSRIEKTTSRIAFIGLAAATMAMTLSIIGALQLQEASAARPTAFCYNSAAAKFARIRCRIAKTHTDNSHNLSQQVVVIQ